MNTSDYLGKLTAEGTKDLVEAALPLLPDEAVNALIVKWATEADMIEELLAQLELALEDKKNAEEGGE